MQQIPCSFLIVLTVAAALHATGHYPSDRIANVPAGYLFGLNFSPYVDGQDPNEQPQISAAQIQARLEIVAPHTTWIRTFGSSNGLEQTPAIARSLGLKVAAGAWIGTNAMANDLEIANLISAAQAGHVDMAIVGSETLHRGQVSETQLIAYINQVRSAIPPGIPVTTADTYVALLAHPNVIGASDVIMANFYPFWQKLALVNGVCALDAAHTQLVAAAGGKQVLVSETGWPSGGNAQGAAIPTPANAAIYSSQFLSWAHANDVHYFYFAAFDETWKARYEGPVGAHWGLWTKDGVPKPRMQRAVYPETVPIDCQATAGGPGTPAIRFRYVPPYGTSEHLQGQVEHVAARDHKVAVYIKVNGGWWTKPTFQEPLTAIELDGSWTADIVTGGIDEQANEIAAFLVPNGYVPPALSGAPSFPPGLLANALVTTQASRSPSAISGRISNALDHPVVGVRVDLTGTDVATTTSAPDGKYSFPFISGTGPVTVAPHDPNMTFAPASHSVPAITGHHVASFTATVSDIVVSNGSSASAIPNWSLSTTPDPGQLVSQISAGVHALSGRAAASAAPFRGRNVLDLRHVSGARLRFESLLLARSVGAEVRVSTDGETWLTLLDVPAADRWLTIDADLSRFTGQVVFVRFTLEPADGAIDADTVWWQVRDVHWVTDRRP
jgi:exo-beta-1,3-glucanase (GH17 family)